MISKLAEEIYGKSIQLKRYNKRRLLLKRNRLKLLTELKEIQTLTCYLSTYLHNSCFSPDYIELVTFMQISLSECINFLTSKSGNYRGTVCRYIWGFHNLSRAFLSTENAMRISPNEAIEYYKPYLKLD